MIPYTGELHYDEVNIQQQVAKSVLYDRFTIYRIMYYIFYSVFFFYNILSDTRNKILFLHRNNNAGYDEDVDYDWETLKPSAALQEEIKCLLQAA